MLKNLSSCYSALSFLIPHCSNMLSLFINFFLSLPCLSPSQVSSLSSLISPLPHHLTQASFSPSHYLNQLFHHCNPENTRKNPVVNTQKPNQKTQKEPHCNHTETQPKNQKISSKNTQNLIENTQKIPPKKKKNTKTASKTQKSILKLPLYTPSKIAPKPSNKPLKNPKNLIANPLLRSCAVVGVGQGQWWNKEALSHLDEGIKVQIGSDWV